MTNKRQLPTALSVVSLVFLVLGFIALIQMVYGAMGGSLRFQFNVFGFWIYSGLRRFSTGWRTCALVLIWVQLIVMPIAIVFSITSGFLPSAIVDLAIFFLELWMYRVLTRPDNRSLFYDELEMPTLYH
jgi:hypothetical protein